MSRDGGHRSDLRAIARRAMLERGLLPDFPPAVVAEVEALRGPAADGALRDLRAQPWLSIDNDDSRDLDQLSVAEALDGDQVRVLVAVADVDALVAAGTPADGHAGHNTTSVYTPAAIFPMLPPRLSTDLTSLNEDADRIALVIELTVNGDGTLAGSDVYRATVRSQAKLAYTAVAAWLDGAGPAPRRVEGAIAEQLRRQDRTAQALRALRLQHGALELETVEPRAVFHDEALVDLAVEETNRAKQLIEDFMVAANGVTARFLGARGLPSLRRVLRSPERWERIVELAAAQGGALPARPDSAALDAFLRARKAADPVRFPDLSLAIVKLLGSGEYVVERPGEAAEGHFGLAVHDYTHSTAPNRRYPDLLAQRLLKAALAGQRAPYGDDELESLARHCTEQEDSARKVERQVRKSAAALLLGPRVGQRFDGIVTGASAKGTWVRIFAPPAEGRVVRGEKGMDVGDRVRVELVDTSVERGWIDFARAR
ncbi:MAG: RNB domain-containing ribonuclease [Candidatus Rokubacteria bacterium]|nr:RNB domain-containing ribonuclease [Candidatus Rokubacteria bacterium]